jgi:hypothetical protein
MSGLIPAIGRDGNRLEYLAHYILSAFGTAVPVLRTEDVGVDFFCALGKTEMAGITVSNSYGVQLKSGEEPRLELGGRTKEMAKAGTWRDYELKWFLDLEFPLFFGVPHAKEKRLDLYSTSLARWFGAKPKLPFRVRIVPSAPGSSGGGIHPDHEGTNAEIENLPDECDGRTYTFNVGPPVISCTVEDLNFPDRIETYQQRFRNILETEHRNTIYRKLGLPYWLWINHVETNKTHTVAYAYDLIRAANNKEALLGELVPFICALGLAYKAGGEADKLKEMRGIATRLPVKNIPENVRKALPELFD